jgi:anti-sigma B factor antagonist
MLKIGQRRAGDVVILDIEGRITPGVVEQASSRAVTSVIGAGCRKLLINLAEATSSDTAGISVLVDAFVAMCRVGGQVKLLKVDRKYVRLLDVVGVDRYFEMFETEEAALASFHAPSGISPPVSGASSVAGALTAVSV